MIYLIVSRVLNAGQIYGKVYFSTQKYFISVMVVRNS